MSGDDQRANFLHEAIVRTLEQEVGPKLEELGLDEAEGISQAITWAVLRTLELTFIEVNAQLIERGSPIRFDLNVRWDADE